MALDREEFERRRIERRQRRLEEQARRKKLFIKLGIAAAALVAVAVIIAVVAGSTGKTPSGETAETPVETGQETTETPAETTQPQKKVIHLAAAGDLNITDLVVASGGASYDFTETFLDIAPILAHADLTVLNFEGQLLGAPYGSTRSAPQSMMEALAKAGVDMIQLANSYAISGGVSGLADTISGVRAAGMEPLGVYATQQERQAGKGYTIRNVGGIKIAMVAFTKGMDGMALPRGSEGCVNVLYTDYSSTYQEVDTEGITKVLDAVAKEKPDITVAMLHWGSEYNDTVSESQNEICQLMQKNGVDAIIGTHPHYVHKMELDSQTGQFVAYSLGDMISDAQRSGTEYSVILDLEITKDSETGKTEITGYSYTPIFTVAEKDKPVKVVRIAETMTAYENHYIESVSQTTYEAMQYALERIQARTSGE